MTTTIESTKKSRMTLERTVSVQSRCIGAVFIGCVVLSVFAWLIFVVLPLQLLNLLLHQLQFPLPTNAIISQMEAIFFRSFAGSFEFLFGTEIVITSNAESLTFSDKEKTILFCNHRTEIDWIFNWNLAMRFNSIGRIKTMMKAEMRHIPAIGWTLQAIDNPFVRRNWNEDEKNITELMNMYKRNDNGTWLAMYPEGTTLCDSTIKSSDRFAEKTGLDKRKFVLHPRVKGFGLCWDVYQPDSIVELTMGFPELMKGVRPSPLRVLNGLFPEAVHIHVNKYKRSEFEGVEMENWMKDKFTEKEERLKKFYDVGKFEGNAILGDKEQMKNEFYQSLVVNCMAISLLCKVLYTSEIGQMYAILCSIYCIITSIRS